MINCILLIDDDGAINFIHRHILKKSGKVNYVEVALNGLEALNYLSAAGSDINPMPDLILLDINMPVMDGWDFIEAYTEMAKERSLTIPVVMLTTSYNPDDREKAANYPFIVDFKNKPLSQHMLAELEKLTNKA